MVKAHIIRPGEDYDLARQHVTAIDCKRLVRVAVLLCGVTTLTALLSYISSGIIGPLLALVGLVIFFATGFHYMFVWWEYRKYVQDGTIIITDNEEVADLVQQVAAHRARLLKHFDEYAFARLAEAANAVDEVAVQAAAAQTNARFVALVQVAGEQLR